MNAQISVLVVQLPVDKGGSIRESHGRVEVDYSDGFMMQNMSEDSLTYGGWQAEKL